MKTKKIGIIGFGHLGQYLTQEVKACDDLSLAFVWNRNQEFLEREIDEEYICRDLENCSRFGADLIVEVAHPVITEKYGPMLVRVCDYMVGSPTAFASSSVEGDLRLSATENGVYVPAGALWGAQDIAKMADRGTLSDLKVTMKKHPSCFKLESPLREINDSVKDAPVTLYEGSVRGLCPLAPNNVNTMAAAAIAAHNLGFDRVTGCLISDPSLKDWHIVEVEATGSRVSGKPFKVTTLRENPAEPGAVTGTATYASFLSSLKRAGYQGPGIHLC